MGYEMKYRARRTREIDELRFVAACSHDILNEIVAADRIEIGIEILDRNRRSRDLDHHADRRHRCRDALVVQFADDAAKQFTTTIEFLRYRYHGYHHLQISCYRGARQRPE